MSEPVDAREAVAQACHAPFVDAWQRIDEELDGTVYKALRGVRARHLALLEEHGLVGEPPRDAKVRQSCVAGYRNGIVSEVLPELERTVAHHHPTFRTADELVRIFERAHRASSDLPEAVGLAWGEGAWSATSVDTVGRRVGKALTRWSGAARRAERTRLVPARSLARRHLERRIHPVVDAAADEVVRRWASWLLRLEQAWATWARDVIPSILAEAHDREATSSSDEVVDPEPDPAGGAPPPPAPGGRWNRIRDGALALDAELERLATERPHAEVRGRMEGRVAHAGRALESDLAVAGSWLLRAPGPGRPVPARFRALSRTRKALVAWDTQAEARLVLHRGLLALVRGAEGLLDRVQGEVLSPVEQAASGVEGYAGRLRSIGERVAILVRTGRPPSELAALRREALEVLDEVTGDELVATDLRARLEHAAGELIESLQALVRQGPARLVLHRLGLARPDSAKSPELRIIEFQDAAIQAFDAMRLERIRLALLGAERGLVRVRDGIGELPEVVTYAFDAVEADLAPERSPETAGPSRDEMARVLEATMTRTADTVGSAPDRMREAVRAAAIAVAKEIGDGTVSLAERLEAGRVQGQILWARSRIFSWGAILADHSRRRGTGLRRLGRLYGLRARRKGRAWAKRLRVALGAGGETTGRAARALRTFALADAGTSQIPLLYRRLFSPEPLTDRSLLVGRAAEMSEMLQRWRRWGVEDEVPVTVVGSSGVGVTSFLNALCDDYREEGARVVSADLEYRIRSESEVSTRLAALLGCEPATDLDDLAATVLRAPREGVPDIVILDGLEHLYLRVPGGTALLERFLTFVSETEPRVFWITGVSRPAWQVIRKAEPYAASQVDSLVLEPLAGGALRETMLQRHRRSGLGLRFVEPEGGHLVLGRGLRRGRGEESLQQALSSAFFEQLQRVSVGNLKLALFHWLLASDFEEEEGVVHIHPLERPDFGALDALDLTQNFTLKALLEHRTLTLEEHKAVFRISTQESYQIFESLLNRRLVEILPEGCRPPPEAHPREGGDATGAYATLPLPESSVESPQRYRIRPLLVGGVTAHLRARNIVH